MVVVVVVVVVFVVVVMRSAQGSSPAANETFTTTSDPGMTSVPGTGYCSKTFAELSARAEAITVRTRLLPRATPFANSGDWPMNEGTSTKVTCGVVVVGCLTGSGSACVPQATVSSRIEPLIRHHAVRLPN